MPWYLNLDLNGIKESSKNELKCTIWKNIEGQKKFKEFTDNSNLSGIFDDKNEGLEESTKKFLTKLDEIIKVCFKKVRIKEKTNEEIENLFKKRSFLKNKTDIISQNELLEINKKLADMCAEINYNKIKEEIGNLKDEEGGVHVEIKEETKPQM